MSNAPPCLLLALAIATPAMALAGPADDPSPAGRLESLLVVRVEMEGAEAVAELLRGEVLAALRRAGVTPELPEGAPLELVVSTDEEANGAYEVVYLHRDLPLDSWSCACSGEELRARLQRTAPTMWQAAMQAAAPVPEPEPAAVAPAPAKDPGPAMGEPGHGMWIAGVATTAAGTGLAVSQSLLLIVRATDDKEITGLPVGLLATGVAMAAAGGVLWGLSNRKRKRAYLGLGVGKGVVVTLQGRF
jgi:hypothetical protein